MEKAKKFFEEIIKTDDAKALFAAAKQPETNEERIAAYLEIAKKLDFDLTAEGILAYFKAAAEAVSGEVDDEELAQLVGGSEPCSSTYKHKESCWFNDGCDIAINSYDHYYCAVMDTTSPENQLEMHLKKECGKTMVSEAAKQGKL